MTAIAVTGIGALSSLGDAITAAAAARAGMSMGHDLEDFDVLDEDGTENAVRGHPVDGAAGFRGFAKLLTLAWGALEDMMSRDDLRLFPADRTGLLICTPDLVIRRSPGAAPAGNTSRDLGSKLAALASLPIAEQNIGGFASGHAGVIQAVGDAVTQLKSGRMERCLVGGVDSLLDPESLEWLIASRRLKTNDKPNGLAPGEAGAFVLLERVDVAERRRVEPLAVIAGAALGTEPNHALGETPCHGEGLARVIVELMASTGPGGVWLVSDHNGEGYRAGELGMTVARLSQAHPAITGAPRWFPASSFGETGAASAALGIILAARALSRGYAEAESALILASSDGPARGALRLKRA